MSHRSSSRFAVFFVVLVLLAFHAGKTVAEPFITLQSTTSTENSGLLGYVLPMFTEKTGIGVRTVAVGTGQALKNARNGDGDVLLVHSKPDEEAFVAEGFGTERHDLMYNDYVVVGPASDPAGIKGLGDVGEALRRIAATKSLFVSRGDDSGTHKKEMALWAAAGVDPRTASGTWYREAGSGMGATINTAIGLGAYTLSDRGTWISFKQKSGHLIALEGDPPLHNQYGIIAVSPERHPHVKAAEAQSLIDWMLGDEGQSAIASFQVDGQQLFFPNAKRD